jgi:diguanylate cyclase (GGDEF)-like protein
LKKSPWLQRCIDWTQATRQEYDLVQGEGAMETLRRFRWVALVMVPLHIALALLLSDFAVPAMQGWAREIAHAHWVAAAFLVVSVVLTQLVLRMEQAPAWAVALQMVIGLGYIYFGARLSIADLVAGAGAGLASFMLVCIMFGVLALLRPALSVPLYLVVSLVFSMMLRSAPIPAVQLTSLYIVGFFIPMLALLASLIVWTQYAKTVLLRRQLSSSNQALLVQQQELAFLAHHDTLTGLVNRREFMRLGQAELNRAVRAGVHTQCVMADLDYFKKINDVHGHPVGDAMLQHVAALLKRGVRTTDTVARLGGEEFIVLLPDTTREGAGELAEKLRLMVSANPLVYLGVALPITASFGVSGTKRGQKATIESIYAAADRALYVAKQLGRNQVQYAEPTVSELATPPV